MRKEEQKKMEQINKNNKIKNKEKDELTKKRENKSKKTSSKNNKKINNEIDNKTDNRVNSENNNKIDTSKKLNKNTFHNYLWYIVVFSIIGLLIETLFCFITIGNIKTRKGLILGPLCPIYGCGAVIFILCLDKYKGKKFKLFVYGTILGAVVEYLISFLLEAIYGARFWDYSWTKFNLNGRICLTYSIFWGILAILLIDVVKKLIDKLINKIQGKFKIIIDIILTIVLVLDISITVWGVAVYEIRAKETINGKNYISNNNAIEKFQNNVFSNENMKKVFPNLLIVDNDGNQILIRDVLNKTE